MSKNITITDDVYQALKREKGDRSFSDVIRDRLDDGGKVADVAGAGVFVPNTQEEVKEDIGQMSQGTLAQTDDETS